MGSLIVSEEQEDAKESNVADNCDRVRKTDTFLLIENLMTTLLQNLASQEVFSLCPVPPPLPPHPTHRILQLYLNIFFSFLLLWQMDTLHRLETMLKSDNPKNAHDYHHFTGNFFSNKLYNLLSCFQIHLLTYCCEYKESVSIGIRNPPPPPRPSLQIREKAKKQRLFVLKCGG